MIILDFGSGNTCNNNQHIIVQMIDRLAEIDKKKQCVIKWQLFEKEGNNIPLDKLCFRFAVLYAMKRGFRTTASIFDKKSLDFLIQGFPDIPFIKIANRYDLYWLIGKIPREIRVITSVSGGIFPKEQFYVDNYLSCVSEYPTTIHKYENQFSIGSLKSGISDHTSNWDLYKKYNPDIYECHYKLENSKGLDAGEFARTPEMLKEIL